MTDPRRRPPNPNHKLPHWIDAVRDFANGTLTKALVALATLGAIVFAAFNANGNSTAAVQKSERALNTSADALQLAEKTERKSMQNERRLVRQSYRIADIAASIDSLAEGVERAVRRGIRRGISQALDEFTSQ